MPRIVLITVIVLGQMSPAHAVLAPQWPPVDFPLDGTFCAPLTLCPKTEQ